MNDPLDNASLQTELVAALLKERRKDRHWRITKTIIWLCILVFVFLSYYLPHHTHKSEFNGQSYVSLVRLNGVIMPGTNFSAKEVLPLLARAFKDKNAKGVVLIINSPGGSPVQASIIHDDIEYLEMDKTGIHVAQYLTELPPQEILEEKLKLAVQIARENHVKRELIK